MNEEQRLALGKSIVHWEHLRDRDPKMAPPTVGNCACCDKFKVTFDDEVEDCEGCPILQGTGKRYCLSTPYWEAVRLWEYHNGWSEEFGAQAGLEVEFLTKLLANGDE